MGDVAMIVPSLRCLTASYPEVKITIVSNILFKPFFKEFENINFFQTDFKSHHKGVKGLMRLSRELIKLKPTHIADLHSVLRTHFLTFFFKLLLYRVKKLDKLRIQKQKLFRKKKQSFKALDPNSISLCRSVLQARI